MGLVASLLGAAAAREVPSLAGEETRAHVAGPHPYDATDESLGPPSDLVEFLPGYGVPPTPQYSGFLDASAAEPGTHLHYWFARCAREDWAKRPTVLWLNGGPGSSSVLGWLQEMGPLLVNRTGGLALNPWSWHEQANVFVLESPAGVGFSYCERQVSRRGACSNTDDSAAAAAAAALVVFFSEKFPKLRENAFYVAGESYAGVYVPTLARAILERNEKISKHPTLWKTERPIPLAGILVGDPCTSNAHQAESMDPLWYANKHGFVAEEDFRALRDECGDLFGARAGRGRKTSIQRDEKRRVRTTRNPLRRGRWRRDSSVAGNWGEWDANSSSSVFSSSDRFDSGSGSGSGSSPRCVAALRRFRMTTSDGFSQTWRNAWLNDLSLYGPSAVVRDDVPGTLNHDMARYVWRADVRAALHVERAPATTWPGPSDDWRYESQYAACNDFASEDAPSMIDFYRYLAPRLNQTIVFNGDTDPCVSYEGTRKAVAAVGFREIPGGNLRPYFVRQTGTNVAFLDEKPLLFGPDLSVATPGVQFAGHVTSYENNLQFVTVHGSGHMVPQFRPRIGTHLLRKLLRGEPFAPPLPDASALASESEEGFQKMMDRWTEEARRAKYVAGEDGGPER
jgi:cathepsin A (carboxypeptidase C)